MVKATYTSRGKKIYMHLKKLNNQHSILVDTFSFRLSSVLTKSIVRRYSANSETQTDNPEPIPIIDVRKTQNC